MEYKSIIKPPKSNRLKSGRVKLKTKEEVGWHVTDKKEELIVVLKGEATVLFEKSRRKISAGKTFYVNPEMKHNVKNFGKKELEYIYVVSLLD